MDDLPGSSPLARGLRHQPADRRDGPGIIPARAGFTKLFLVMGVPFPGSSPLARGLHGAADHDHDGPGIIPARAGFTTASRTTRSTTWDHPRSRGVYWRAAWPPCTPRGSSPLARGLLYSAYSHSHSPRIIPARAGSTDGWGALLNTVGDHPRSRGVYYATYTGSSVACGSSPLARGILHEGYQRCDNVRIIPACAGFTVSTWDDFDTVGDHPRSRGVYMRMRWLGWRTAGSSPLARGLRGDLGGGGAGGGIIPARAGFTPRPASQPNAPTDHPRSRGVYPPPPSPASTTTGSSPLARGLPEGPWAAFRGGGIIPARAGFTPRRPPRRRHRPDHPRSRGVYPYCHTCHRSYHGSSPLARGLRALDVYGGIYPGIIPARAGFTTCVSGAR